tara:strand:- start:325 stop:630 length:306 start_codon:yes stop_codon:yes gene_type:complete
MIRELLQAVLGHNEIQDTGDEPRLPMINPCPPGYVLRNVGGSFQCVLEDLQNLDDAALRRFLMAQDETGTGPVVGSGTRTTATPVSPLTIADRSGSLGGTP